MTPVCWGYGIDDGRGLAGGSSADTICSKSSPTSKPTGTTTDTIYTSEKPTAIPGATIASMDGQDYITGLNSNGQAYYWGMYGSRQTTSYTNVASCTVDCDGKVSFYRDREVTSEMLGIVLAGQSMRRESSGGMKSGSYGGGNVRISVNGGTKTTLTKTGNRCNDTTHYGFTKSITYTNIGKKSTTIPPTTSLTQSRIASISGNVYAGLVCGTTATSILCDGNGTSTTSGQLGNGSTSQKSGPQLVTSNGWLTGKQVTQLSTGSTGYTCAIASGAIGCWGVNTKGQLGINTYDWYKTVPTGVGL